MKNMTVILNLGEEKGGKTDNGITAIIAINGKQRKGEEETDAVQPVNSGVFN